jgi:hypothetical protein
MSNRFIPLYLGLPTFLTFLHNVVQGQYIGRSIPLHRSSTYYSDHHLRANITPTTKLNIMPNHLKILAPTSYLLGAVLASPNPGPPKNAVDALLEPYTGVPANNHMTTLPDGIVQSTLILTVTGKLTIPVSTIMKVLTPSRFVAA